MIWIAKKATNAKNNAKKRRGKRQAMTTWAVSHRWVVWQRSIKIHPRNLRWSLIMMVSKGNLLFQCYIFDVPCQISEEYIACFGGTRSLVVGHGCSLRSTADSVEPLGRDRKMWNEIPSRSLTEPLKIPINVVFQLSIFRGKLAVKLRGCKPWFGSIILFQTASYRWENE